MKLYAWVLGSEPLTQTWFCLSYTERYRYLLGIQ